MGFEKEIVIVRIAQKFFNNSLKHSRATKISVLLNFESHHLQIELFDNGVGMDIEII
ncbi:ATP-binding protein [Dyadobacter chenwenxiniae]|uniref:ATP-binding protein n=1 Tax=Dyadobacter chenwenxiniae TaxID=2906456 RepID=UPI0035B58EEB